MKCCCAAILLIDALSLSAHGSLKVSDILIPDKSHGDWWAFTDKSGQYESLESQGKSVQKEEFSDIVKKLTGTDGSLKVSKKPDGDWWAFKDKSGQREPFVSQGNSVQKPGSESVWGLPVSSAAKVGVVAAKNFSKASEDHPTQSRDIIKKLTGSARKMKVHSRADLMHSLEEDREKNIKIDAFLPLCVSHIDNLIAEIDYNYGDAQLETTLRNYCVHTQEFPRSHGGNDGFLAHVSCKDFATDLWNARMLELKTQKKSGYKNFCTKFYEHHGGREVTEAVNLDKNEEKDEPGTYSAASTSTMWYLWIIAAFMSVAK